MNCWFCNNNSQVPLISKDEWHCLHCDQFNGFDRVSFINCLIHFKLPADYKIHLSTCFYHFQDGNYSKEIPEQYNENLNSLTKPHLLNKGIIKKSNGLCRICNANQELKIRQLAVYEPFREDNYDQEIEWFK